MTGYDVGKARASEYDHMADRLDKMLAELRGWKQRSRHAIDHLPPDGTLAGYTTACAELGALASELRRDARLSREGDDWA
jgi:hypothetical protein